MAPVTEQPRVTLRAPRVDWIYPVLMRRRGFILVSALIIFGTMAAVAVIRGPLYEARATLLVRLGRQTAPVGVVSDSQIVAAKRPEDVNNEIEIMRSQQLIGALVDHYGVGYFTQKEPPQTFSQKVKRALSDAKDAVESQVDGAMIGVGLRRKLSDRDRVIVALEQAFIINNVTRSDVIELTFRAKDPEGARDMLEKFVELYMERHIQAHTTPQVRPFFDKQTAEIQAQLAAMASRQREVRQTLGAWSPPEQRVRLLDWQQQLRSERTSLGGAVVGLTAEVASLKHQLAGLPVELDVSKVVKRNGTLDKLRQKVLELTAVLAEISRRYPDDSRNVQDAKRDLEQVHTALQAEETTVVVSVTTDANEQRLRIISALSTKQAALDAAVAQAHKNETQFAQVADELRKLDAADVELRQLDRETARLERDYTLFTKSQEEARIFEQMDNAKLANVAVVAPPEAGMRPVAPSLKFLLLGGLVMAFGLPIGLVMLLDALRPAVRSREDIRDVLGVPVVARIPEMAGL